MTAILDKDGTVPEYEKMHCEDCRYYDAYLDTCTEDLDEEYPDCWEPIISTFNQEVRT